MCWESSSLDPGMASCDVPSARKCRCVWELRDFRLHVIAVSLIVSAAHFDLTAVWFHELLTFHWFNDVLAWQSSFFSIELSLIHI